MTAADPGYLPIAMFNGSVVATGELRVSPLSPGFMFGEGLFETVRVHNSQPVLFEAHHARLAASLDRLGAPPAFSQGELYARCTWVIGANSLVNGSLKIVVFKEVSGWSQMILARPAAYTAARYETGFRLKTVACDLRIGPLHALKSLNYLPNIRAKRTALAAGFDEAIFFDPLRHVLEGATTNVFIVKDQMVCTPPLSNVILPGVMRAYVIQRLDPFMICEREIMLDELFAADEVFVTNALLGIMPVARIDGTDCDIGGNRITRSLIAQLAERLLGTSA